jgi:hypothetical protein
MSLQNLDDVSAFLKAHLDEEAQSGFPRLTRIPSTGTIQFLDYFGPYEHRFRLIWNLYTIPKLKTSGSLTKTYGLPDGVGIISPTRIQNDRSACYASTSAKSCCSETAFSNCCKAPFETVGIYAGFADVNPKSG